MNLVVNDVNDTIHKSIYIYFNKQSLILWIYNCGYQAIPTPDKLYKK